MVPDSIRPVATVPLPGYGEDVLDGHVEGLVDVAHGGGDVVVDRVHQVQDGLAPLAVLLGAGALQRLQGASHHDRDVVPGELVLGEELAHLQLHQLEQLGVVHHVGLVEEDHHGGHLHLAGEQDVLAGLGHGPVGRGDHQDGAVHLGGTGDHVLDVVGVAGAVHVGVVALGRLVLHVGDGDGDAPLLLLGGVVDGLERAHLDVLALLVEHLGDGGGQHRLAVVYVADRADVHVRLGPLELLLGHGPSLMSLGSRDYLLGDPGRDLRVR